MDRKELFITLLQISNIEAVNEGNSFEEDLKFYFYTKGQEKEIFELKYSEILFNNLLRLSEMEDFYSLQNFFNAGGTKNFIFVNAANMQKPIALYISKFPKISTERLVFLDLVTYKKTTLSKLIREAQY